MRLELSDFLHSHMRHLSHKALRVYLAHQFIGEAGVWSSLNALKEETGLSEPAVIAAKKELEAAGHVRITSLKKDKLNKSKVQPMDLTPCLHDMDIMRGRRRGEVLIVCKGCGEVLERTAVV